MLPEPTIVFRALAKKRVIQAYLHEHPARESHLEPKASVVRESHEFVLLNSFNKLYHQSYQMVIRVMVKCIPGELHPPIRSKKGLRCDISF